MMNLSKSVGYAVHALSCIDQGHGQPRFVQEIADQTGVPKDYLARVINRLVHRGLVISKRGYCGGVSLARPARQISLLQIVEAMHADEWSRPCFFGLEECPSKKPCPAHASWVAMRRQIEQTLRHTTLADITEAIAPEEANEPGCRKRRRTAVARAAQSFGLVQDEEDDFPPKPQPSEAFSWPEPLQRTQHRSLKLPRVQA